MVTEDYQKGIVRLQAEIEAVSKNIASYPADKHSESKGIVICGGGYCYFTNAWILVRMLRQMGCELLVELWATGPDEVDDRMRDLMSPYGVEICFPPVSLAPSSEVHFPLGARWQWVLKPYAIIHSKFEQVLYLDADCFPVRDPSFLFECPDYLQHGAIFWPDLGVTEPTRPIWDVMGVPFRMEPEFESGQIVVDKRRCWEPLQLTLWMNRKPEFFYGIIWGDKDTFRFSWHKFGRSFGMVPYPVQLLQLPGGGSDGGVMCQHDFEGNWLFQHRNLAKWDLLGENPRIAGYLFDGDSRRYLAELRAIWNGRVLGAVSSQVCNGGDDCNRQSIVDELIKGYWLFEDRRPKSEECDGDEIAWTDVRTPLPWLAEYNSLEANKDELKGEQQEEEENAKVSNLTDLLQKSLRYREMTFLKYSIGTGAQKGLYWWELRPAAGAWKWKLELIGEHGVSATLGRRRDGSWSGVWQRYPGKKPVRARLLRCETLYPEAGIISTNTEPNDQQPLHIANHALGIGDAVTGIYVAAGIAKQNIPVIYHTRFPEWFGRASFPGLTITGDVPPAGCVDLNADYAEQLRYASNKVRWYCMMALAGDRRFAQKRDGIAIPSFPAALPKIDRGVVTPVLDFERYVLLAPFADWETRNWLDTHWRRLAHLLYLQGYEVVAIGLKKDDERLRNIFDKSNAYWVVDQSPAWVTSAMLHAQAVVGVDSGMLQMAGLLGVPGICIHSQLSPKFLFSSAPSIFSLVPETHCRFCHWQEDRGFNEGCANACSALATVSPELVLSLLESAKLKQWRLKLGRNIDNDTRRARKKSQKELVDSPTVEVIEPLSPAADIIAYTYAQDCGLGEAAAMNIKAFRVAGFTVEERIWERQLYHEPALKNPKQIYYHHWHPQPDEVRRNWLQAGFGNTEGAKHLAFWAYEIENELPEEFRVLAPLMSEVWTPSHFCRGLFRDVGPPVYVVPHAVPATDEIHKLPSCAGRAPFRVLYLFDGWSRFERKNPEAAIRVFQKAFPRRHDVRLILKGRHLSPEEVKALQEACSWDSRITVLNQFLSVEELNQLFLDSDVLLSLQRGEGFGLNIARALGIGLPVITTGWGGQLDFCKPNNSFLVPYKLKQANYGGDYSHHTGMWAEPNEKAASALLIKLEQMVAQDAVVLQTMRQSGRNLIATEFSQHALNLKVAIRLKNTMLGIAAKRITSVKDEYVRWS